MSVLALLIIQLFPSCICLLNVLCSLDVVCQQSSCCPLRALNWLIKIETELFSREKAKKV